MSSIHFLKWIQEPENKIQVLELAQTCEKWGKTPSEYWFPTLSCHEARYVIDREIMKRYREIEEGQMDLFT